MDPYTKPRTFDELRDALQQLLEIDISTATLYRLARRGELPTRERSTVELRSLRSTVAAYLAAMTPIAKVG